MDNEITSLCALCYASEDVIRTKSCSHLVCLRCMWKNDRAHCPMYDCGVRLSNDDIWRKNLYARRGKLSQ